MNLAVSPRDAELLARMSDRKLREWLKNCGPRGILMLDAAYELWAAKGQIEPRGKGWRTWLMLAGRGYGKTRAGAEWVHRLAMTGKRRIALVGATIDEARAIMVEGQSGVLSVAERHNVTLAWEPSRNQIRWPSGSVATLYSGDKADGLRGPEHDFAWCADDRRFADFGIGRSVPGGRAAGQSGQRLPYRIAAGATGAFAGKDGALAGFTAGGWRFVVPSEGMRLTDRDSGVELVFRSGSWSSGSVRAHEVVVDGVKVVGARQAAIAGPVGGAISDVECRVAVDAILAALRAHGLIAT